MSLAEAHRIIPALDGAAEEFVGIGDSHASAREDLVIDGHRSDRELFPGHRIAGDALGGAAVISDHAKHVLAVLLEALEGAEGRRHLGAGCVRATGENRGHGAADGATGVAVVGDAGLHEHGTEVGVSQTERSELPGELGHFTRGEGGHQDRDLEHDGPESDGVLVGVEIEVPRHRVVELDEVQRGQIARGVVKEHVLRAGIAGVDSPALRAGVPLVDGGVVLDAGIGTAPRGEVDLLPEFASSHASAGLSVGAANQRPIGIAFDGFEVLVGDPHRVVGVLPADGEVGLAIEVVVELETESGGELLLVLGKVLGTLDHRSHLEFLADLPADELADVGMIDIEADHFGGAAGGASALDGRGGAIADLQEAHQAAAATAAGERLVLAAQRGEVGSGAGAVLEESSLADPQIHDAALVDEVVADRLDEAGVGLRMRIRIVGQRRGAGDGIGDPVSLGGTGDPVGGVQSGVEPLWTVGRGHLVKQRVGDFIGEGLGVALGVEVAVPLTPLLPA